MNRGRTGAPGLLNRFDKQFGADRRPFGFDRTDIEPHDVAVTWREVEHFTRSNEYAERGSTFDDLTGVKVARKMDPEVDSVPCGSYDNVGQTAVCEDARNALAPNAINLPDAA